MSMNVKSSLFGILFGILFVKKCDLPPGSSKIGSCLL